MKQQLLSHSLQPPVLEARVKEIYQVTPKVAKKLNLTRHGAEWFMDRFIICVKYKKGGEQCISLSPSKTAFTIKKKKRIFVETCGNYITFLIYKGKRLKGDWCY